MGVPVCVWVYVLVSVSNVCMFMYGCVCLFVCSDVCCVHVCLCMGVFVSV